MCGISGIINKSGIEVNKDLLANITDVIAHRGPDDFGYFIENNFGFGHRRLSILDLSKAGHQPMCYLHLTITYNGEIYNYIELREELVDLGYSFKSQTDTEVILAAYSAWGTKAFDKFNGMWAFAIYDKLKNEIICSRDRFGIKPFNYTQTNTFFAFGSEIKQLLLLPNIDKSINQQVLKSYLVDNLLNTTEDTFISSIKELRGGHYLQYCLNNHTFKVKNWYTLPSNSNNLSFEESSIKLKKLFTDSVKLRMRSDVSVGSCLSGGLDSSSIVCTVFCDKLNGADFKTVSSCYADKASDEQEYIDEVINQTHFEGVKIFPKLNDLFDKNIWDKLIYHQDQPILSFSHFSEYAVFEAAAKNDIVVLLDGQGSDEYLAGYSDFIGVYLSSLKNKGQYWSYFKFLIKRAKLLNQPVFSAILFRLKTDLKQHLFKSNKEETVFNSMFLITSKPFKRIKSINDLSREQILNISIPYQLHSEDRNSMLHSVESRLPFLDYKLVEFCLNLPENFKIRNAQTKAVLREGLKNILPTKIYSRHDKKGFPAPDELFFKEKHEEILPLLTEAYDCNQDIFIEKLVKSYELFLENKAPYSNIWLKAISFHKWKNMYNL